MPADKWWFPIVYMFLLTAFFSSVVIGFTAFTRERVGANERLAFETAVLKVLPGLYDPELSRSQLHQRFGERVSEPSDRLAGALALRTGETIKAYALPISGQGFWAPIKGVVGIDADGRTLTGIAFYEQNETPGLGAEITGTKFRAQFEGKAISLEGKPMDILRPSAELGDNDVHAVTGATQTSTRLEKIINDSLRKWRLRSP